LFRRYDWYLGFAGQTRESLADRDFGVVVERLSDGGTGRTSVLTANRDTSVSFVRYRAE